MHRPMLVLVNGKRDDARSLAESYLERFVIDGDLQDYYNPISCLHDPRYRAFEEPVRADDESAAAVLADLVKSSEKHCRKYLGLANDQLSRGATLGDIRTNLRLAVSPISAYVFDATRSSFDYVFDGDALRAVMEDNAGRDVWVCGFDVHC